MKLAAGLSATLALLAAPALARADGGVPSITYPDPGDDMVLGQGMSYQVAAANAAQLECTITQGSVKWSEKMGGSSTGCAPSFKESQRFKPGPATLAIRAQIGKSWTAPVTIQVHLVAAPTAAPADAPAGPKSTGSKSASPRSGTDAGFPPPASLGKGDARPASWDSAYTAGDAESHGGFLRCPTAHNMRDAFSAVSVKNGVITFHVELQGGATEDDPRSMATFQAQIGPTGAITGSGTLSADNQAYLVASRHRPDGPYYKLAKHFTYQITGTAKNLDYFNAKSRDLDQGRVINLTITDKANLTAASGQDDPDACDVTLRAADFFHKSGSSGDE